MCRPKCFALQLVMLWKQSTYQNILSNLCILYTGLVCPISTNVFKIIVIVNKIVMVK